MKKFGSLLLILTLFLLWRAAHLAWLHPAYYIMSPEELYRGTIAREWLRGPRFPWIDYRADDYSGGSLVIGWVVSLFFRVLGPTVLALKIAPFFFFGAALVFWTLALERHAGKTAAWAFGLLYCFSAPSFTLFSMTTMGYHSESILFTALTLLLVLEILTGGARSRFHAALLGGVAGVGLWFSYVYAVTLAALIGCLLVFRSSVRRDDALLMTAGFLIGFSPWIKTNLGGTLNGLCIGVVPLWKLFSPWRLAYGLRHDPFFFVSSLAGLFAVESWSSVRSLWTNGAYAASGGALIMGAFVSKKMRGSLKPLREWSQLSLFVTAYVMVFALVLETCRLGDLRYRIPLFPFFFVAVALAVQELQNAGGCRRVAARTLLVSLLGLGVYSSATLFSRAWAGQMGSFKGYSCRFIPSAFQSREACLVYYRRTLPGLDKSDAEELTAQTILQRLADLRVEEGLPEFEAIIEKESLLFQRLAYFFYPILILERDAYVPRHCVEAMQVLARGHVSGAVLGTMSFVYTWAKETPDSGRAFREIGSMSITALPEARRYYDRGKGYLWARTQFDERWNSEAFRSRLAGRLEQEPFQTRREFVQGAGQYLFDLWNRAPPDAPFSPVELEKLPSLWQPDLFLGAGAAFAENLDEITFNPIEKRWRSAAFQRDLTVPSRAAFAGGAAEIERALNL